MWWVTGNVGKVGRGKGVGSTHTALGVGARGSLEGTVVLSDAIRGRRPGAVSISRWYFLAGWGLGEETVVVVQLLMLGPATCIRLALYWEMGILDEGVLR